MTLQGTAFETDVTRCVLCDRKAELMLSITSPKDGRTLRIFRCECGKLTSAVNRHSDVSRAAGVHGPRVEAHESLLPARWRRLME